MNHEQISVTLSYIVIWLVVLFQLALSIGMLARISELRSIVRERSRSRSSVLGPRSTAPPFSALDVRSNRSIGLEALGGRGGVILFLSPDCSICRGLAENSGLRNAAAMPMVVVCQGENKDCRFFISRLEKEMPLVLDSYGELGRLYGVSSFPTTVVIDKEMMIRMRFYPQTWSALIDTSAKSLEFEPRGQSDSSGAPSRAYS